MAVTTPLSSVRSWPAQRLKSRGLLGAASCSCSSTQSHFALGRGLNVTRACTESAKGISTRLSPKSTSVYSLVSSRVVGALGSLAGTAGGGAHVARKLPWLLCRRAHGESARGPIWCARLNGSVSWSCAWRSYEVRCLSSMYSRNRQ